MNIGAEDVWPLVLDFIKKYVGKAELKAFKKHFSIEIEESDDPLVKAGGIQALLQSFFKNNKQAYKAFVKAKKAKAKPADSSSSNHSESEDEKPAKKKAKKEEVGSKRKRTDSQASATAEKSVPKKRKRTESMNSVKSNGSTGGGPVTRRMSMDAADASEKAAAKPVLFKRINTAKYDDKINHKFVDNSFEAKARFGQGGDSYGSWSNSKLADKKGASFIKEKNKMKNRQSHASGTFNAMSVNSIRF